jgi:outer membrane protein assembly factor BamB
VAAVIGALVVVGGANAVQIWQERAAGTALDGVPGFVPAMPVAPEVVWSLPQGHLTAASDDVLLVADSTGTTTAVEVGGGATLWSTELAHPDGGWSECRFVREGPVVETGLWLRMLPGTAAASVVCAHRTTSGAATESRLQVLDARTGRLRAERTVPGEPVVLDTVEGDVVHGERDAAGRVQLTRWDPEADADVWKHRLGGGRAGSGADVWVALLGDRVLVQDAEGSHLRSLEHGEELAEADAGVLPVAALAEDATLGVDLSEAGTFPVVVSDGDGSERLRLEGWFAGPMTIDPRTPAVLVRSEEGALAGHDVRDGTALWTRPREEASSTWSGMPDTPLAQVGHRLVLAGPDGGIEVLDVRDGTLLWSSEDLAVWAQGAISDGRSVVVPGVRGDPGSEDARPVLVALDLRDGTEVWSVPLAAPAFAVHAVGGLLVVEGEAGVVALRP